MKKELLLTGVGVTAVGSAIGITASNLLIRNLSLLALARDLPKMMRPSKPKNEAVRQFRARAEEAGNALRQKNTEEVEITSRDGLRLVLSLESEGYPMENNMNRYLESKAQNAK